MIDSASGGDCVDCWRVAGVPLPISKCVCVCVWGGGARLYKGGL